MRRLVLFLLLFMASPAFAAGAPPDDPDPNSCAEMPDAAAAVADEAVSFDVGHVAYACDLAVILFELSTPSAEEVPPAAVCHGVDGSHASMATDMKAIEEDPVALDRRSSSDVTRLSHQSINRRIITKQKLPPSPTLVRPRAYHRFRRARV